MENRKKLNEEEQGKVSGGRRPVSPGPRALADELALKNKSGLASELAEILVKDEKLAEVIGGHGDLSEMTAEQIRQLIIDAGYRLPLADGMVDPGKDIALQ